MRKFVTAGAVAFLAVGVLAGCNSGGTANDSTANPAPATDSSEAPEVTYRLGLSDPVSAQPLDAAWGKATIAAGKRVGIDVTVLDAALDANKQVSDIDQFVAQEMDGIIVFPLAPDAVNPALQRAQAAGIKTIASSAVISETPPSTPPAHFDAAWNQNSDVGGAALLAAEVIEQLGGKGNVLGVGIGFPVPALQFMLKNYEKYVTAGNPDIKWLGTVENPSDDIAGGERVVAEAITRFQGEIDAVMAYNTASAIGAAIALEKAGIDLKTVVIVGQNGDPQSVDALKSGQIDAFVDLVPWRQGLIGIEIAKRLFEGKAVPAVVYQQVELYTMTNIDQRLDWDKAIAMIASGELTCANGGCPPELIQ